MIPNKEKFDLVNWEIVSVNPIDKNWSWTDLFCFWAISIQSIIGFSLIASLYLIYDLNFFVVFFGGLIAVLLTIFFSNLIMVVLIWCSTFLIQVPLHNSLSKEKDIEKLLRLVHTNWIRTILWTVRSALMISFLYYTIDLI